MKTIDDAAKDYLFEVNGYYDQHLEEIFIAGAQFAQEWIPVEKELPEEGISVLTKDKNGYIGMHRILYGTWDYKFKNTITHWRPITRK